METNQLIQERLKIIHSVTENYIQKYLELCESEIEKLFILNLFIYFFSKKFEHHEKDNLKIVFDDFRPHYEDKEYSFDLDLIGVTMMEIAMGRSGFEDGKPFHERYSYEYTFIPQFQVFIENSCFRIDIALVYKKLNHGVIEKEVRVAIVCDGYDFHNKKEQVIKDSIITKRLMANGWKVIRYTGSEIYRTKESDEIESVLNEIKKIVQS